MSSREQDPPESADDKVYETTPQSQTTPQKDKKKKNKKKGNDEDEKDKDEELEKIFQNLPADEAEILRNQVKTSKPKITYLTLYRYATAMDWAILSIGYFASIVSGAALPLFTLVFGNLTQEFSNFFTSDSPDLDKFQSTINHSTLYFVYLGVAIIVASTVDTFIHVNRGEVMTARIRQRYLEAVLKQNVAYFDKLGAGEVTTRITTDTNKIQEGISEKAGFATFVCAFVVGFVKSWKLALILLSVVVAITLAMGLGSHFILKYTTKSTEAYGTGSSVAEESLSAIRNTVAFGSQSRLLAKFDGHLVETMKWSLKQGYSLSCMVAFLWATGYWSYSLAFWQGSRFVVSGDVQVGQVVTVIMAMMIGAFVLGNMAPSFQAVGTALASATKIFEAIDRVPSVDSSSDQGDVLEKVEGRIELKDIKFIYPSRPDVTVLPNMNLTIEPGETVALVGTSGSGKSTIVGLIERFYDPVKGKVLIDGVDVATLNLRWLRQQISLVSQEPTLFAESIYENICFGLIGTENESASEEKKRELVIEACKQANAWEFIQNLTDGLDTNVGDRGYLMSGGQKQRIAIARAIISNPKILLLDEATSALDTKSEGVVQEALDRAAKSRTTITIAHRLSTIKDADKIVVMSRGEVVEVGSHSDLIANGGPYSKLVNAQRIASSDSDEDVTDQDQDQDQVEPLVGEEGLSLEKKATTQSLDLVKTTSKSIVPDSSDQDDGVEKRSIWYLIKLLYQFNKKEKVQIMVGAFFSFLCGLGYPALSILFAKVIAALMVTPDQYAQMRKDMNMYTGFFFMVGCILLIGYLGMIGSFTFASERLVRNIRHQVFKQYLRMDIGFFDKDENTTGSLVSTLSKDAQSVQGLGGATIGQILQSLVTLVAGIIVAVVFNWRLGLVCASTVPALVGCGFIRYWVLVQLETHAKKSYEESGSYACESIAAIRTVASLTRERGVMNTYRNQISSQIHRSRRATFRSAFLYGVSQGLSPLIMGLGFWYGSTLLKTGTISSFQFFVAFAAVIFGAEAAGSFFSFCPDMSKAKQAADNISTILDKVPEIDTWSSEGISLQDDDVRGDIQFKGIHFRYPTRPHVPVLRGLNLTVKHGQYVALVGASGCGKSTTISLLERFYNPLHGKITLDGHEIDSLNVNNYRSHIAMVQQEPVLYSGSIRENIMLGSNDPNLTEEDMYAATRKANIHDFIVSLPEGYETYCGSKGALLSGGQKQRIAIARALIRNPKVLLLDEATSALDSESEKIVQAALDEAAKGRTTIAVAHRLSTIQNADYIYVFDQGKICESGTHNQLLAKRSKYYELVQLQTLDEPK